MESTEPEQQPVEEKVEEPFDEFEYKKKMDKQLSLLNTNKEYAAEDFNEYSDASLKVKDEEKNWRELKSYKDDPPMTWLQTLEMIMIILGEPEEKHLDWQAQLVHCFNNEQLISKLTSYDYSRVTKELVALIRDKMENMEGGFDVRKQFNKKLPTAPLAQWIKEWFQAAEAKVKGEDLADKIKEIEEDMKIKLKL